MMSKRATVLTVGGITAVILGLIGAGTLVLRRVERTAEAFGADALRRLSAEWDYDALVSIATEGFIRTLPRERWDEMLQRMRDKLGAYRSHTVRGWHVESHSGGGSAAAVRARLLLDVEFERDWRNVDMQLVQSEGKEWRVDGLDIVPLRSESSP